MVRFCNDCDKRPEIPIDENNNKKEIVRSKEVKMGGHTQDHDLHCEDHGQCIIFMEGNGMARSSITCYVLSDKQMPHKSNTFFKRRMKWQLHVIT
ncbi:hypothetical protein MRB53_018515 [Persea americana]|uniref:Uncharacterized protein n=1 Tax=Persea americana TaxID=3435 RepID=A0ACC2M865_PERAE|nr:hypothetical protein MRB53_018515 [Persea americana]